MNAEPGQDGIKTEPGEILAYIALGSNLGPRGDMLDAATESLRAEPAIRVGKISDYYSTAPVGGPEDQPEYLNAVVEITTTLGPEELMGSLLDIEKRLGRKRTQRWGPRCIDLDLLLYGQRIIETESLHVPHPLMHQREFVLRGLAQIAPGLRHPVIGLTSLQIWQEVRSQGSRS